MVATSYIKYSAASSGYYTDCGTITAGNSWDYYTRGGTEDTLGCNTALNEIYHRYTTTDAVTSYEMVSTFERGTSYWTDPVYPSNAITDNGYVIYNPSGVYNYYTTPRVIAKEDLVYLKRQELRSNLVIQVKSRNDASKYPGEAEPERKALETLREIITETEFRKYLRYGFVLVKGKSGATYQIFKNRSHCKVWLGGKLIEEVCVRIKDKQIPLTDNVIAFKTLIETSEEEFKKLGNVYKMVG